MASEISSSDRSRDWANLLPEILTLIAKRLAALDYLNFSSVCTSWASIASPSNGMPPPLPLSKPHPFLLLHGDDGEQSESCTLLDISDDPHRSYKIGQLPEVRGKWFIGSQFGWLALVDEYSNPSLLNPFTGAQIELPPITTLPDFVPTYDSEGSLSGYMYHEDESYTLEQARSAWRICKVALSSDPTDRNFTVVAIFGIGDLIFVRPGEKTWNYWNKKLQYPIVDVIYREGKFLALTNFGDVYEIDHCNFSVLDRVFAKAYTYDKTSQTRYLVDSLGDLLHVYRQYKWLEDGYEDGSIYKTNEIEVHRLDPETGAWVPVTSLGDQSLFVGTSYSISIPTGGENGVKGNSIYFTDNYWGVLTAPDIKKTVRDMGVFDMNNKSFETLYPPNPQLVWPSPIWIASPFL